MDFFQIIGALCKRLYAAASKPIIVRNLHCTQKVRTLLILIQIIGGSGNCLPIISICLFQREASCLEFCRNFHGCRGICNIKFLQKGNLLLRYHRWRPLSPAFFIRICICLNLDDTVLFLYLLHSFLITV